MKLEFENITVWEAYDERDWGGHWGTYTTKEEALEALKKNSTSHTDGIVKGKVIRVVTNYAKEQPKAKQGNILKLYGSCDDTYYVMIIAVEDSKYNSIILPDLNYDYSDERFYTLDNFSDCNTIEELQSRYKRYFDKIEIITMQQYLDEMSKEKSND